MPVNKVIRVQVTGADVIHSFAVPSFGIKIDAVPGALNETWFTSTRKACSTASARNCAARITPTWPIAVRVVNDQEFAAWVQAAQKKFAANPDKSFASIGTAAQ